MEVWGPNKQPCKRVTKDPLGGELYPLIKQCNYFDLFRSTGHQKHISAYPMQESVRWLATELRAESGS